MWVTLMSIVVRVLVAVPKGLEERLKELEIRGRSRTIQITALLRLASIFWRVLEIWGDLLSLRPRKKILERVK